MQKFLTVIQIILDKFKAPLKAALESEAMAAAILNAPFLPIWMTKLVVKWALNQTANPAINEIFAQANYRIEVLDGKIIWKKIKNASDPNDWDDASNSV